MVNTSARQAGDPGFDSRVAQQNLLFIPGTFTFWHCNCRGPSADSVQIEHSSSVQHKGNPNHSTSKISLRYLTDWVRAIHVLSDSNNTKSN